MSGQYVRTLRATLLNPTAHKRAKLERLEETYHRALQTCLDADCQTMGETNAVVTPFSLPYQVKDALKSYVPTLANSKEIGVDPPVRFVNRAARFDREQDRTHEFTWRVPQPGRGTDFWIPLRINPQQVTIWNDLVHDRHSSGEIQLLRRDDQWRIHVAVSLHSEVGEIDGTCTSIGIYVGEQFLLTATAIVRNKPVQPLLVDGKEAKRLRKELFTTVRRLQRRDAAEWRIDERKRAFRNALTDVIEQASRSAIDYANEFENPVIVMEDLSGFREGLDTRKFLNRRLHSWGFARLQRRIGDKAMEAGIPVQFHSPAYTSKRCHACGTDGNRPDRGTFECTNAACHITEFQADINAAANIAKRTDLGGETGRMKHGRDDSLRDGSAGDSATGCHPNG